MSNLHIFGANDDHNSFISTDMNDNETSSDVFNNFNLQNNDDERVIKSYESDIESEFEENEIRLLASSSVRAGAIIEVLQKKYSEKYIHARNQIPTTESEQNQHLENNNNNARVELLSNLNDIEHSGSSRKRICVSNNTANILTSSSLSFFVSIIENKLIPSLNPALPNLPSFLHLLLTGSDSSAHSFKQNIKLYNSTLAFTSMGAKIDPNITGTAGIYSFRIHDEMYHSIGTILPDDGAAPQFAQLYIYDTEH
ncbi:12495_t:CDS:2 [Cetraspora pellucida]|uniref:12495_t:CDS:1 n=1 Tax=Cetraspora pellucida TaxID=1433469 RepID=A0A9N8ZH42_9GLOM|nr:12495_t:CDS:2 [Cetraspora pellucida]